MNEILHIDSLNEFKKWIILKRQAIGLIEKGKAPGWQTEVKRRKMELRKILSDVLAVFGFKLKGEANDRDY